MKVQPLKRDIGNPEVMKAFRRGEFHIVCLAKNGMTTYNAIASAEGGIDLEEAVKYADQVNRTNEVGTIYPKMNLTLIPFYPEIEPGPDREAMRTYILDCIQANEKYVKCPEMIFLFEWDGYLPKMAKEVLEEVAETNQFVYTEIISCFPF